MFNWHNFFPKEILKIKKNNGEILFQCVSKIIAIRKREVFIITTDETRLYCCDIYQNIWWTVRAYILGSQYFFEYHLSSSNITNCQVPSRVRARFHDTGGDKGHTSETEHNHVWIMVNGYWFLTNVSQPISINCFNESIIWTNVTSREKRARTKNS